MESGADERLNMSGKRTLLLLGPLIALGLLGNYLRYEIFFSIQFIFGSIFALLALQFLGLRLGVAAAFVISLITYPLWNHPYAIVILTAEVATVGMLYQRRGLGLVLADALYWLCIGIPLVILFYSGLMHLPFYNVAVTMMKQAVNGIANALTARLFFMVVVARGKKTGYSLRELSFSLLVLFVLLPSLLLLAIQSRSEFKVTEQRVHYSLDLNVQRLGRIVDSWLESHLNMVKHLAWAATVQPLPVMQAALEQTRAEEGDFLRLGLFNDRATTIAYSPLVDELGQKSLGRSFADRPYLPQLRRDRKPMLSEVVMGRIGTPRPIAVALAPVVKGGGYAGFVSGALDLERLRGMITADMQAGTLPEVRFVLLDKHGKVIVSSRPELKAMELYQRREGEQLRFADGIIQWLPTDVKNISISDRWAKALYVKEGFVGGNAEWRLVLEQPLAPFQKRLYERYAWMLAGIFLIMAVALVIAEVISRSFARTLEELQAVSTDIPAKITAGTDIAWPDSTIGETRALVENYKTLARVLAGQFGEIRRMNAELESRVEERTRELQTSEARYRSLMEASAQIVWTTDLQGAITEYSPSWLEYTGQQLDAKGGYGYVECIHPEDRESVLARWREALEQGVGVTAELRLRHHSGEWRWNHVRAVPLRNAAGKVESWIGTYTDIHDRKVAESALRGSEQKYRELVEAANSVILRWASDGTITFINDYGARFFGYAPDELVGRTVLGSIVPVVESSGRDLEEMIRGIAAEPLSYHANENENITKDGRRVWLRWENRAISGEDGKPAGILSVGYDITERKAADQALRESEERFRTLFEKVRVVCLVIDPDDGSIIDANSAAAEFYGWSKEELCARKIDEINTLSPDEVRERVETIRTEKRNYFIFQHRRADGSLRDVEVYAGPIKVAGKTFNYAIVHDITDRVHAEDALRESEERFRTLFENAAIAVFIHAEDGMLIEANRKALADNGLTRVEELRARDFWLPPPYSLAEAMAWLRKAATEGPQHFEWQDRDRQGRRYWRDMTIRKTILNGQPRLIAIAVDITDRKQAEALLRNKTAQLENMTKTLEQRVNAEVAQRLKNEQILVQQSKLAALGETLGAIAHQWRQPLNTLGLIVQNLKDAKAFGELDGAMVDLAVAKSMAQIQHMSKTIDDFRNFFQPDKEKCVFEAVRAVGDVLALFSAQLEANGIGYCLTCHECQQSWRNQAELLPCPETLVFGYRNEFEHVLLNLVNNARDAILARREAGGLPGPGQLDFAFHNRQGRVVITVSDNGGGIDPQVIGRVFEPYFTTKAPAKGTGLGLYMTKVIIEEHMAGTITVANGEQGAVFTIALAKTDAETTG